MKIINPLADKRGTYCIPRSSFEELVFTETREVSESKMRLRMRFERRTGQMVIPVRDEMLLRSTSITGQGRVSIVLISS
jgi:hypothetical protein